MKYVLNSKRQLVKDGALEKQNDQS